MCGTIRDMEVYIEYVIIDNWVFTYCICALSHRLTRTRGRFWRDGLAAVIGTVVAVFYPFLENAYLTLTVKLVLCAGMTLICYPPRRFLRGTAGILAATCLFGGVMFGAGFMRYGNVQMALSLPVADFPLGLVVGVGIAVYFPIRRLVVKYHKRADCADSTAQLSVEYNGVTVSCTAFLDSGNRIYDSRSGLPVIVLGMRVGVKLLSDEQLTRLAMGKPIRGGHFESYRVVGGRGKLFLVKPNRITLYRTDKANTIDNAMVGLSLTRFTDAEEYDALLNPALLKII